MPSSTSFQASSNLSNSFLAWIKIVKWDDFVVMEVADTGIGVVSL
jgi:hypothetical protein